jgi:hypothetical protein
MNLFEKWSTRVGMGERKIKVKVSHTLKPFKLSTTHARRASLPTVTVMLGIGSANLGKLASKSVHLIFNAQRL